MADTKKEQKAQKENEGSVAARAWNQAKLEGDPDWDLMPNTELKGKLEFAVDRVRATGIAQTNFEIAAKEILASDQEANKDEGPNAVVAPAPALGGAAPLSVAPDVAAAAAPATPAVPAAASTTKTAKSKGKSAAAKGKATAGKAKGKAKAKSPSAKAAAKTDKSGHVPTAEETAAAVKAEKDAPLRP